MGTGHANEGTDYLAEPDKPRQSHAVCALNVMLPRAVRALNVMLPRRPCIERHAATPSVRARRLYGACSRRAV